VEHDKIFGASEMHPVSYPVGTRGSCPGVGEIVRIKDVPEIGEVVKQIQVLLK
jgi:hypothetical protein